MKFSFSNLLFSSGLTACFLSFSCGNKTDDLNTKRQEPGTLAINGTGSAWKVRAFASVKVGHKDSFLNLNSGNFSRSLHSGVAASISFLVDDSGVSQPSQPWEGPTAFGKIVIRKLRDNNLRVCGASGAEKCLEAMIRIFTGGTPSDGYWNEAEQYGLPIWKGDQPLLSTPDKALVLGQVTIGDRRVLNLSDFDASTSEIPLAIDFTDAAKGSYYTEIKIEYLLR